MKAKYTNYYSLRAAEGEQDGLLQQVFGPLVVQLCVVHIKKIFTCSEEFALTMLGLGLCIGTILIFSYFDLFAIWKLELNFISRDV